MALATKRICARQTCIASWLLLTETLSYDLTRLIVSLMRLLLEMQELRVVVNAYCVFNKTMLGISVNYTGCPCEQWLFEPHDRLYALEPLCEIVYARIIRHFLTWVAHNAVDAGAGDLQLTTKSKWINAIQVSLNRGGDHWLETDALLTWMRQAVVPFHLYVQDV